MVDDALIFVNFNANVGICLARDGSWLQEVVMVDIVATLSS